MWSLNWAASSAGATPKTGPGIAQRLAGVEIPGRLGERFETLARVMAMLRSSDGCPWDLEQTPESLSRHLLEEAYETVEAIDSEDWANVSEEMGDLLLQIVFQSRIAEEARRFDLGDVVDGITEKLERRHPHIFGEIKADTPEQVSANWERIKREQEGREPSMKVPPGLPAVMAAMKVQGHAAREGFDWDEVEGVLAKLEEEMDELEEVRAAGDAGETEHELGDILFTVVNLARHLRVDPEQALRRSTREFARRYEIMASEARRSGTDFAALSIDEKERLWQKAKLK
jgi:tetrapyrrole methylase family protein/MazG family protein